MEQTPEPVLFEANPDKTVEAYCKNPEIPNNPNYTKKPLPTDHDFDSTPSSALQRMFNAQNIKNMKSKQMEQDIIKNRMNLEDFKESEDGDDYDAIPENDGYSDSDQEITDSDNGNGQNIEKNEPPLLTKVVVLDLD